jgi:SAM-dependent methyltransferase
MVRDRVRRALVRQFHGPSGLTGRAVGLVLAHRPDNVERNRWAVGLLDLAPDATVLEVGFGAGLAVAALAERCPSGRVCGVDHSAVMVRQARRRNRAAVRAGRVDLRCASIDQPGVLAGFDARFDAVLAVNSLGMWPSPIERLREIGSVMAPGGTVAIVSQPRCPGADAATTVRAGQDVADQLAQAGFTVDRRETLDRDPPVVCVLAVAGDRSPGSSSPS